MDLKPGSRWQSAVCNTEIVVVRPPKAAGELQCGGKAVLPLGAAPKAGAEPAPEFAAGTLVGKRYVDTESGVEVLGSKAGTGSLAFDGRALQLKEAKPLPASD